jgi:surface glycoprotein (TIGR04207 family)
MSSTREKFNAGFLAAIMVLSMVAMSAAFAAPAAAQAGSFTFSTDQVLEDDLEVTISAADFDQESAVVITNSTSNEVVGVNESLAASDFNGDDVQVALTGNLETDLSTDDYSAYAIDQGATIPSVGGTYADGDASGDQFDSATGVTVYHTAYSVVGVEGPVSTFHGDAVDVTANITNLGVADNTEDITINDDNSGFSDTVSIDGINGEFEEFTFENIDTTTLGNSNQNSVVTESLTVSTDATADTTATTQTVTFTVGTTDEGEVFVDVRNADAEFSDVEGATVTISNSDGDQIAQAETPASGTVSFAGLAVSADASNPERYTVQASAPDQNLDSDQTVAELFVDNNDAQRTDTVQLNLRSNVDAQYVDVVRFDDETNTVLNQDAALFANGEFDNTGQFAVITQNQENEDISTSLDVTVDFTGDDPDGTDLTAGAGAAYNDTFGQGPGSYADDNDAVRTLTLTVNSSSDSLSTDDIGNANQIQNASGDSPLGNVSVETFNVTSALANETTLNDPVITESFTAEATNNSGDLLGTDSGVDASRNGNNVTYFLEGDTKISGQVQSLVNGETVYPDATVYVAYGGGPQDLSTIESFENDQGVSFLTAEPNENGDYIIDGLVEEAVDGEDGLEANLYVVSEGFNRYNMTKQPAPLSGTFAAEYVAPLNKTDVTQTANTYEFTYAHVLEETALAYDLDVTAEDTNLEEQVKDARVRAGETSTIEVSVQQGDTGTTPDSAAANQQIDVELTDDDIAGELVNADDDGVVTTETNSNGVAEVTFDAAGTQTVENAATLSSNVTASTVNADGDEYNTTADDPRSYNNEANQSTLTVFATGQITGDVVDAADTNIPDTSPEFDVEVELFRLNDTSDSFDIFVDNTTTGDDGSFSFVGVPTGQDYRAVATVTRTATGAQETGTSRTINNLEPVTENADIVIEGLELEEVFVINSLEDAQANAGEEVTVSATVSNIISEESTQNVTLALEGDEVETREVTIPGGEDETVEFSFTAPEDADDYDWSVSSGSSSQTATLTVTVEEVDDGTDVPDVNGDGAAAQDLDGDGFYEDVDGDGELDIFDVQTLFENQDSEAVQDARFNFNEGETSDEVDIFDVQALFEEQQAA